MRGDHSVAPARTCARRAGELVLEAAQRVLSGGRRSPFVVALGTYTFDTGRPAGQLCPPRAPQAAA